MLRFWGRNEPTGVDTRRPSFTKSSRPGYGDRALDRTSSARPFIENLLDGSDYHHDHQRESTVVLVRPAGLFAAIRSSRAPTSRVNASSRVNSKRGTSGFLSRLPLLSSLSAVSTNRLSSLMCLPGLGLSTQSTPAHLPYRCPYLISPPPYGHCFLLSPCGIRSSCLSPLFRNI